MARALCNTELLKKRERKEGKGGRVEEWIKKKNEPMGYGRSERTAFKS